MSGEGKPSWPISHVLHLSLSDLLFTSPTMQVDFLITWRLQMKIRFQFLSTKASGDAFDVTLRVHSAEIQYRLILMSSFPLPSTTSSIPRFDYSKPSI